MTSIKPSSYGWGDSFTQETEGYGEALREKVHTEETNQPDTSAFHCVEYKYNT